MFWKLLLSCKLYFVAVKSKLLIRDEFETLAFKSLRLVKGMARIFGRLAKARINGEANGLPMSAMADLISGQAILASANMRFTHTITPLVPLAGGIPLRCCRKTQPRQDDDQFHHVLEQFKLKETSSSSTSNSSASACLMGLRSMLRTTTATYSPDIPTSVPVNRVSTRRAGVLGPGL